MLNAEDDNDEKKIWALYQTRFQRDDGLEKVQMLNAEDDNDE